MSPVRSNKEIYSGFIEKNRKKFIYLLIFLIVALGFFLRIYNINTAPPGVYPDEAVNGEDAVNAIKNGQYQWFYPSNQGREGFFINLIALCFKLFGISVLTLKLPSIIFGTLTIFGTYLLGKEIFNQRVGLISAFLVSVSFWAINFSRISFRANMLPFILVFSFYFLFKGLRTNKSSDFAIGGFIFGAGLHTYIAFRIAPLILLITLFSLMASRQSFLRIYWKKIIVFIMLVLMTALPMLYTFFYAHPEYFESRSDNISILSSKINQGHLVQTFAKSFILSMAKYNFWGDQNWRHNYPPYPILDPLTGFAFLFGFIYSLFRMFGILYFRLFKKVRNSEMDKFVFLMIWFFAMLAPEFMTAEGNPHALRSIGTLPVVFIFSGIAFDFFLQKAQRHTYIYKKIIGVLIIIMMISIGLFNSIKYHVFWANKIETARSFEKSLMDISAYIKDISPQTEKFILTGNMQRIPIKLFNDGLGNTYYFNPGQSEQVNPKDEHNFIVILTERNDEIINSLRGRFPDLRLEQKVDSLGISFYILK